MKTISAFVVILASAIFFAGCYPETSEHPNNKPTAESGSVHGAPTKPSTSTQN